MNKQTFKNEKFIDSASGGLLYSLMIVSVMLVSIVYSLVLSIFALKDQSVLTSDIVTLINYALGPIAILIAIGILRFKKKSGFIAPLFKEKVNTKHLIATFLIFLGLTFGLGELNNYFVLFLNSLGLEISAPTLPTKTPLNVTLVIIFVAIMPAIVEEIAFRGIILSSLKNTGVWFTLIISGVLFSFFHMSPAQTIFQFLVGVIYSYIILSGGSLILTISMHFLNNLYIILNYYFFGFELTGTIKIIVMIISVILLGLGILLLYKKQESPLKAEKKQNIISFTLSAILGFAVALVMWVQGLL